MDSTKILTFTSLYELHKGSLVILEKKKSSLQLRNQTPVIQLIMK